MTDPIDRFAEWALVALLTFLAFGWAAAKIRCWWRESS